ncbi:PAP-associated domain-containing protein [Plasmodiophora brassicae]
MEMPAESNDIPNDDNWTAAVTPTSYDSPELAARLPDEPRIKSGDPSSGELLMQYSRDTRMEDVLLGIAEFLEPPPMGDPYFDADVLGFLDWVNGACNAYDPIRDVVRRQIERIVQVEFPGSTVAPMLLPVDELYKQALFTGLDLTIVNSGLQSEGLQYLKALRERVNRLPSVSSSISLVLLPFPKLIFKLRDGPLLVTLSWNVFQPNMFATEAIIRYPLLKPVMLYVWYFLVRHGFHDVTQGGVDWQLLQVMVVSHIQMNRDVCQAPSQGRCLRAFFTYYGKRFDYNRDCISVTGNGRVFPKTDRGATALHEFRLCAESPDDPNVDVGRQAYNIAAVVDKFRQASDMLYDYYPGLLLSEDMLGAGKHALVPPA